MNSQEHIDAQRSALMKRVRRQNTTPEMRVREALTNLGLRYRLNVRTLPGSPDIVFRKFKKIIFVHGCFWHRHEQCKKTTTPKTRQEFWIKKFEQNVERDLRKELILKDNGWEVLVVWECETLNLTSLKEKLLQFLE